MIFSAHISYKVWVKETCNCLFAMRYKKSSRMPLTNNWGIINIYSFVSGIRNGLYFCVNFGIHWDWAVSWIEYNLTINVPFPQGEWRKLSSILLSLQQSSYAESGAHCRIKKYAIVPFFHCLLWVRVVNPETETLEWWKKCFDQNSLKRGGKCLKNFYCIVLILKEWRHLQKDQWTQRGNLFCTFSEPFLEGVTEMDS